VKLYIKAGESEAHFLLASGKPLNEPVAWSGSVAMNMQEELQQAYREIRRRHFYYIITEIINYFVR